MVEVRARRRTCSAHFKHDAWGGAQPELGDYLVSTGQTWYRVVGIAESPRRVNYTLERVDAPDDDTRYFEFYWLERGARSR